MPAKRADARKLTLSQQRAWLSYMQVYHRLEYEMNRQLQTDSGLSLSDYTVMNALSHAPNHRLQLSSLAITIGWELSRLSHHLQRMQKRGLVARLPSDTDGRASDAVLTDLGWTTLKGAAPAHAASVVRMFFSDLKPGQEAQLADILSTVYESIIRGAPCRAPTSSRRTVDDVRPARLRRRRTSQTPS